MFCWFVYGTFSSPFRLIFDITVGDISERALINITLNIAAQRRGNGDRVDVENAIITRLSTRLQTGLNRRSPRIREEGRRNRE